MLDGTAEWLPLYGFNRVLRGGEIECVEVMFAGGAERFPAGVTNCSELRSAYAWGRK